MVDWKKVGFTAAYIVLGLMFLMAGGSKLAGQDPHPANFANWGYPDVMMYVVGAWEVAFAILLFVPKTRFYGAALLLGNMVGAAITHVTAAEYSAIGMNVVLGALAFLVAWLTLPSVVAGKLGREPGAFAQ